MDKESVTKYNQNGHNTALKCVGLQCAVILFSKLYQIMFGYFDPVQDILNSKNIFFGVTTLDTCVLDDVHG